MRAGTRSQVVRELLIRASSRPSKRASGKETTQKIIVFFAPSRKSSNTTENAGIPVILSQPCDRGAIDKPVAPQFTMHRPVARGRAYQSRPYPMHCAHDTNGGLRNADLGLLVIPHLPFLINALQRAILLENAECLVDLGQQLGGVGIALVETNIVIVGVDGLAQQLQFGDGGRAWPCP